MQALQDVQRWRGCTLVDNDGEKIGTIEDIYLDRQSGEPEWVTVKTGLLGRKSSFVPISDASSTAEDEVRVPYAKDQVKDAPSVDPDGQLSEDEERQLYQHYGRSDYAEWSGEERTGGADLPEEATTTR
jgi:sporulation protein YlmC with PRC-barrel domain